MITLTGDQLIAWYWHPFPPEEGYKYDLISITHMLAETADFGGDADDGSAVDKRATAQRSVALAGAAAAVIEQARVECKVGASLDAGSVESLSKTNGARLESFVDGLLAASPVCDVVPLPHQPGPAVLGTHVVIVIPEFVVPRPVPPEWGPDEQVGPFDLLAVATRFKTAAKVAELAPMHPAFDAAADRLIEAVQLRFS